MLYLRRVLRERQEVHDDALLGGQVHGAEVEGVARMEERERDRCSESVVSFTRANF